MGQIVRNGQPGVDDLIVTIDLGPGDSLLSSTYSGNDTVAASYAEYAVHLGAGNDVLSHFGYDGIAWGEGGDDTLSGILGAQATLFGGSGNDQISLSGIPSATVGMAQIDAGTGNDLITDSAAQTKDVVQADGGDGFDIYSFLNTSAGMTVWLDGSAPSAGLAASRTITHVEGLMASAHDDTVGGSAAANLLVGGGGNDLLIGGRGDDLLIGDGRNADFARAYLGRVAGGLLYDDPLDPLNSAALRNLAFASDGGGLEDTLQGGSGNDVLMGGDGGDLLQGGAGLDWASYVAAPSGVWVDLVAGGQIGHAEGDLYDQVENVQGSGFEDTVRGNGGGNEIRGMAGNDSLFGLGGNDTLSGDAGQDTLSGANGVDLLLGGAEADVFVLSGSRSLTEADTIGDMVAGEDVIWLSRKVFGGIGPVDLALEASRFATGPAAADGSDRIIYDPVAGALYYDADGDRAGAQVLIAHLAPGLGLTAADFLVVD